MRRVDRCGTYQHWQGSTLADPFAVNPIRRSLVICLASAGVIFLPWLINEQLGTTMMMTLGWLAITGLVFGVPVLLISLMEFALETVRSRLYPPVEHLGLSPRVLHILRRHGYATIEDVRRASDAVLLSLSNMDDRALREIRKQLSLRQYREWQDAGFPLAQ
jgi:RNA polymerase alpha subunit